MPSSVPARTSGAPVYVLGEALIDVLEERSARSAVPGGSAANVALGLARRGIPVRFSTRLGRDAYGRQVAEFLGKEGVDLDSTSFTADRTSTAVARRDPSGDVSYEFDIDWELPDVDIDGPMGLFHLGSFPAFSSDADVLSQVLTAARSRVPVTFDPNVRPDLISDRDDACRRFERLAGHVDVLKLSDADAEYLMPGSDPGSVTDTLLGCGVRLVIVTMGDDGLLVSDSRSRVHVPATIVPRVADTIGAGDTVMASVIADIVQGSVTLEPADDLELLGRRAADAAAITVSRAGADLPRTAELSVGDDQRAAGSIQTFARALDIARSKP